jgi:hypothetical protein
MLLGRYACLLPIIIIVVIVAVVIVVIAIETVIG